MAIAMGVGFGAGANRGKKDIWNRLLGGLYAAPVAGLTQVTQTPASEQTKPVTFIDPNTKELSFHVPGEEPEGMIKLDDFAKLEGIQRSQRAETRDEKYLGLSEERLADEKAQRELVNKGGTFNQVLAMKQYLLQLEKANKQEAAKDPDYSTYVRDNNGQIEAKKFVKGQQPEGWVEPATLKMMIDYSVQNEEGIFGKIRNFFTGNQQTSPQKEVVRTGTDKTTGKKVIQYSDGSIEYANQ